MKSNLSRGRPTEDAKMKGQTQEAEEGPDLGKDVAVTNLVHTIIISPADVKVKFVSTEETTETIDGQGRKTGSVRRTAKDANVTIAVTASTSERRKESAKSATGVRKRGPAREEVGAKGEDGDL